MNETMDAGEPTYTTTEGDTRNTDGPFTSGLGLVFVLLFIIIIISYGSCIYKRRKCSQPPSLPPTTTFDATGDSDHDGYHFARLSQGLDDGVLASFPTFLYSEDYNFASHGCSICLADYKSAEVIRLLPECGHLFHVSCVDTWLKVHPTCPVCRKSPLPTPPDLT